MPVRRVALPLAAAGALVSLVACGGAGHLDDAATQRAVGEAIGAEVEPAVTATRCPRQIERDQGATFRCTVTLQGAGELPVTVTQVDDQGRLRVEPDAAVVSAEAMVSELESSLEDQFDRSFQASCDVDAFVVRRPGSTATCVARDATSRRTVTVTVTDAAGTLAFAVGKAAG